MGNKRRRIIRLRRIMRLLCASKRRTKQLLLLEITSWWTSRHVAIFPTNLRVSGITPWSIRGTAVWIATHVGDIVAIKNFLRNPPVTMRTLFGPSLTGTTRPGVIHVATVTNPDSKIAICYGKF